MEPQSRTLVIRTCRVAHEPQSEQALIAQEAQETKVKVADEVEQD